VGRNADGARDLFAPVGVGKEMLTEALTSHTAEKCSRNDGDGEQTCEAARPARCTTRVDPIVALRVACRS
jgi:hypothetical protein